MLLSAWHYFYYQTAGLMVTEAGTSRSDRQAGCRHGTENGLAQNEDNYPEHRQTALFFNARKLAK